MAILLRGVTGKERSTSFMDEKITQQFCQGTATLTATSNTTAYPIQYPPGFRQSPYTLRISDNHPQAIPTVFLDEMLSPEATMSTSLAKYLLEITLLPSSSVFMPPPSESV